MKNLAHSAAALLRLWIKYWPRAEVGRPQRMHADRLSTHTSGLPWIVTHSHRGSAEGAAEGAATAAGPAAAAMEAAVRGAMRAGAATEVAAAVAARAAATAASRQHRGSTSGSAAAAMEAAVRGATRAEAATEVAATGAGSAEGLQLDSGAWKASWLGLRSPPTASGSKARTASRRGRRHGAPAIAGAWMRAVVQARVGAREPNWAQGIATHAVWPLRVCMSKVGRGQSVDCRVARSQHRGAPAISCGAGRCKGQVMAGYGNDGGEKFPRLSARSAERTGSSQRPSSVPVLYASCWQGPTVARLGSLQHCRKVVVVVGASCTGAPSDGNFVPGPGGSHAAVGPRLLRALRAGARRPPSTSESKAAARIARR